METQSTTAPPLPAPLLEATLEVWLRSGERHLIPVSGGSMLPLIQEGDKVLVAHGRAGARRGDVVVFRRQGKLIAHRLLRIVDSASGPIFITKGDNAPGLDPPAGAGQVLGRVLAVERNGRAIRLDRPAWRVLGRLLAESALARNSRRRHSGNRLAAFLARRALALRWRGLWLIRATAMAWPRSTARLAGPGRMAASPNTDRANADGN
ncbi:MAG: S24/S26 family peptidase [Anaerolineae bacterium]